MHTKDLSNSVIFPLGGKVENENFSGKVWVKMLTPPDSDCPIANVTFEPGCINSWHKHPGGQILLVTGGKGYYQERGKSVQALHAGDVVNVPPDIEHWHGAARGSWFVHIAVMPGPEKGPAEWGEAVSDEDYDKLK
jgi:quercetin dioxygenase-like cupin family protein